MRTMILLMAIYGQFPEWLPPLVLVWYILSCIVYWLEEMEDK